jgi:hypothetical protein
MKLIAPFIALFFAVPVFSQELNCDVNVNSNPALDVTTVEKEIFEELKQAIFQLMNSTTWSKDDFEVEERVNCALQLSIIKVNGGGNYEANLQFQVTRPVYNTTYNTTLFNFLDEDVSFTYRRNQQFNFTENQWGDNLTSILAFYSYYALGLDGDSFSKLGGTPYFDQAVNIVTLAQSKPGLKGWRSSEKGRKNRYWLIENARQELFEPLRICFYEYHRDGLDQMYDNQNKARNAIEAAIKKLVDVNNARPGSVNISNFLQSKRKELKGVFKDAERKQKTDVVNMLRRIDPANSSKYQEILE